MQRLLRTQRATAFVDNAAALGLQRASAFIDGATSYNIIEDAALISAAIAGAAIMGAALIGAASHRGRTELQHSLRMQVPLNVQRAWAAAYFRVAAFSANAAFIVVSAVIEYAADCSDH